MIRVCFGKNKGVDSTFLEDNTAMLLGLVAFQAQTQFFNKAGLRAANDELNFRSHELGLFAQDEWKLRPNLTVTYGLRWEYYGVPYEVHGNLSNLFVSPSGTAPFTFSPVGPGTGHQLFQNYYCNFEPHVGFARNPRFKTLGSLAHTTAKAGVIAMTRQLAM
jgi:hypothetical protein